MTTEAPAQSARKPDPRRARTRAALIAAARRLLAEGRVAVSVQEITTEAGVGFGSFYNHFDSKEDLFSEAVANTLDIWGGRCATSSSQASTTPPKRSPPAFA